MQPARFVRTLVPSVMLGLAGFVLGCSNEGAPPVDKETGKKIAVDTKTAQQELRAERGKKGGPMLKNSKRGGPEQSGP